MADKHSITFDTGMDNSSLIKELKEIPKKIKEATETKEGAEAAKLPIQKRLEEANKKIEEVKNNLAQLEDLKKEQKYVAKNPAGTFSKAKVANAKESLEETNMDIAETKKQLQEAEAEAKGITKELEKQDSIIRESTAEIENQTARAEQLREAIETPGDKMRAGFAAADEKAKQLEKRIMTIYSRVFVFQMLTKVLRTAREYFGGLLAQNQEYQEQLARLRAALATAFQPLYEVALPILLTVLRVLTAIVSVAANVLSAIFGKTLAQSAQNAKGLNQQKKALEGVGSAAKEASKQLAGFDEINQLSDNTSGAGGGGAAGGTGSDTMNFDGLDTEEYKRKIDELTVYVSGALLALGAILAFSGANIPLGIGLMAAGAIGLATVISENWNAMPDGLKKAITRTLGVLGGAALVIGAILTFSSAHIPLGIGLMVAGAAALGGAAALNWNAISQKMQGPMGAMAAIVSAYMLVVGAMFAFSGANIPLGIALMMAGTAGLVTVGALNWNAVKDKLKTTWDGIRQWFNASVKPKLTTEYWADKFDAIGESIKNAFKGAVNTASMYVNKLIGLINGIQFSYGGLSAFGQTIIPSFNFKPFNIPPIPMLAQGAVIPPNAPFMAMLGDQSHGNNIEAPEDLIRRIVREESGAGDADLMREQNELLRQILAKTGVYLDGKKLSDTVTSYQTRASRARGV